MCPLDVYPSGELVSVTNRSSLLCGRTESSRTEASVSEKDSVASDEEEEEEEEILGSDDDEQEAPSDYKPGM